MVKKTVLVIEDSPYLADSLSDMLNLKGYEAIIAPNGREGVMLANDRKPDLILLDIRLPDIDGYEVYRRIKEDNNKKEPNIIVLTASESIDKISENIDLPRDRILFKPQWSITDLLQKIADELD